MRKITLLILAAMLVLSSCRKKADYIPYIGETSSLAYKTYAEQFKVIWNGINTGYVFWDVDKTDWDAVYHEYLPRFEDLDARHADNMKISTSELKELYMDAMGSLIDHHMYVKVINIHAEPNDDPYFSFNPSTAQVKQRSYYHDRTQTTEDIKTLLEGIKESDEYTILEGGTIFGEEIMNVGGLEMCFYLFQLPDGRVIPYLWQNIFAMNLVMKNTDIPGIDTTSASYLAAQYIRKWMDLCNQLPAEQLAGIILDNRCNIGGMYQDIDIAVGSLSGKPFVSTQSRYKEGSRRLEHSVWADEVIKPFGGVCRDLEKDNIPYVVLSNLHSISMGELVSYGVSQLPTGYMIGERTYGATGALYEDNFTDCTYGGPFGDEENGLHYIYTSTFEARTKDGAILEGIGFSPDKEMLTNDVGVKAQLDAALEYIMNYK